MSDREALERGLADVARLSGWPLEVVHLAARCAFPAWLRARRAEFGIPRDALAEAIGRTRDQIRDLERGAYQPGNDVRHRLVRVFARLERARAA